ncbi:uncharacterized protein LOC111079325 [Drosophila obscura]|uniref:uncharacterized protein LOC111079325 n=1 Tax=Drosophila obscura TaxID=7282 RepID=UPI000BA02AB3|nr:uncharacterized protein LOC111079325 [Drosophila obscura]
MPEGEPSFNCEKRRGVSWCEKREGVRKELKLPQHIRVEIFIFVMREFGGLSARHYRLAIFGCTSLIPSANGFPQKANRKVDQRIACCCLGLDKINFLVDGIMA